MLLLIEENPYLRKKNNNEKYSNCRWEFKEFETY